MKKTKYPIKAAQAVLYEDAVQEKDEPRMRKVSVTVDHGLLSFVDHYVPSYLAVTGWNCLTRAKQRLAKTIEELKGTAFLESPKKCKKQKRGGKGLAASENFFDTFPLFQL